MAGASIVVVLCFAALLQLTVGQGCGKLGQACCSNLSNVTANCISGLFCDASNPANKTCQLNCGKIGQACCGSSGCDSGLFCQDNDAELGTKICTPNCGLPAFGSNPAQRCCRNNFCKSPSSTNPTVSCDSSQMCVIGSTAWNSCGSFNQPCCTGDTCGAGMYCDTTSFQGQKKCRMFCGGTGQRCCPVVSAGYNGCNTGQNLYCESAYTVCMENCANEGQKCCSKDAYCNPGTFCNSAAYCDKNRSCGAPGAGCCPVTGTGIGAASRCALGRRCSSGVSVLSGAKCNVTCGVNGSPCCPLSSGGLWCETGLLCKTAPATAAGPDVFGQCIKFSL